MREELGGADLRVWLPRVKDVRHRRAGLGLVRVAEISPNPPWRRPRADRAEVRRSFGRDAPRVRRMTARAIQLADKELSQLGGADVLRLVAQSVITGHDRLGTQRRDARQDRDDKHDQTLHESPVSNLRM